MSQQPSDWLQMCSVEIKKNLTGYNIGDEEMCFLSQEKDENHPWRFKYPKRSSVLPALGLSVKAAFD